MRKRHRDHPSWLKILLPLVFAGICLVATWDDLGNPSKGLELKVGIMIGIGVSGAWLLGMVLEHFKARRD